MMAKKKLIKTIKDRATQYATEMAIVPATWQFADAVMTFTAGYYSGLAAARRSPKPRGAKTAKPKGAK